VLALKLERKSLVLLLFLVKLLLSSSSVKESRTCLWKKFLSSILSHCNHIIKSIRTLSRSLEYWNTERRRKGLIIIKDRSYMKLGILIVHCNIIPRVPSGEATNPLNMQSPFSSLLAYPAIGVRQDPSKVSRKALSHATASLVSSWFKEAK